MSTEAPTRQQLLRGLPRIDDLLAAPAAGPLLEAHSREGLRDALREATDALRSELLARDRYDAADLQAIAPEAVLARAGARLEQDQAAGLCRVINGTGVVMHTGLGRSAITPAAQARIREVMRGYSLLEVDRESGERGTREVYVDRLIQRLTGAEAATVVNNNAAATLLILAALARGKEVICSRGQLVEIGGSFRIPAVMEESGARLVEVGATNKTHLADYARAITEQTGALLRVHTSNYKQVGFTKEVSTAELATLGREHGIPVIDDLGSGCLAPFDTPGLPEEPLVRQVIAEGADIVCFSGDKLLGAPQAGIIAGKAELVARCRRHSLFRAVRPDKLTLAGLEATLQLYLNPERFAAEHTTYRMLTEPAEAVRPRAEALAEAIAAACPQVTCELAEDHSQPGSGALPATMIPTWVVRLTHPTHSPQTLGRRLRLGTPCIFSRIANEQLVIDARTLLDGEPAEVADALAAAVA